MKHQKNRVAKSEIGFWNFYSVGWRYSTKMVCGKFSVESSLWKYSIGRLTRLRFGFSAYLLRVGCVKSEVSADLYADQKRFIISRATSRLADW